WAAQQGQMRCGNDYLALARHEMGQPPSRRSRKKLAAIAASHPHHLIRLTAFHPKAQKVALGQIRKRLDGMRSLTIDMSAHRPPLLDQVQKLVQAPQAPPCILSIYANPWQEEALGRLLL